MTMSTDYGLDRKKMYMGLFSEPEVVKFHDCVQIMFLGWGIYEVFVRETMVIQPSTGEIKYISFDEIPTEGAAGDWHSMNRSDSILEALICAAVMTEKFTEMITMVENS